MGKYFMGKGVKLLTEETENKIRIYKLGLLQPEFGHMPCISGNAFTFLLAEEGEIQCQINQEKVDLEAGEALFINAGQSYRLVRSEKESSSFYIIEVAGEYLAAGAFRINIFHRLQKQNHSLIAGLCHQLRKIQMKTFFFRHFLPLRRQQKAGIWPMNWI